MAQWCNNTEKGGLGLKDFVSEETRYRMKNLSRIHGSSHPSREMNAIALREDIRIIVEASSSEEDQEDFELMSEHYGRDLQKILTRAGAKKYTTIIHADCTASGNIGKGKSDWKQIAKIRIEAGIMDLNFFTAHRVVCIRQKLARHNIVRDGLCPTCSEEEMIQHLFIECDEARKLWRIFTKHFKVPQLDEENIIDVANINIQKHKEGVIVAAILIAKQEIWRNRVNTICEGIQNDVKYLLIS